MHRFALALCVALLSGTATLAAPSLRGDVTVNAALVTVGDLFDNAGAFSETAIFRAPAPGTTGIVALADVQHAARLAGLADFDNVGYTRVRVVRAASLVDEAALDRLIGDELTRRGALGAGITPAIRFDVTNLAFNAEQTAEPAHLSDLRYNPTTGTFAARFTIAGIESPVDLSGTIEQMTTAPRLKTALATGTILSAADFELAPVPVGTANAGGYADVEQLVGKQLVRQIRAGVMLRPADVAEPTVVTRNSLVTVILKVGAMTLTVRGQALTTAAAGQPVDVLNSNTRKILHGVARPDGTVEIVTALTASL